MSGKQKIKVPALDLSKSKRQGATVYATVLPSSSLRVDRFGNQILGADEPYEAAGHSQPSHVKSKSFKAQIPG